MGPTSESATPPIASISEQENSVVTSTGTATSTGTVADDTVADDTVTPSPQPTEPPVGTALGPASRVWLALVALGAGVIVIAVGAGSAFPLTAVLVLLGGSQIAWGLTVLGIERVPIPRLALPLFLGTTLLWGTMVTLTTVLHDSAGVEPLRILPMACASALSIAVAFTLVIRTRTARTRATTIGRGAPGAEGTGQRPGRFVLSLVFAALVVSAVTTPALAATNAGQYAVPHGEHGGTSLTEDHTGH
jgi:hypothetical protein